MYTPRMMSSSSTGADVAQRIRDAINAGRWEPGSPLRQEDLASEYKVSRIPVRDALGLLQGEGLVTIEPNRGAYVTTFSLQQVSEMFDLRVLLETDVLERAMSRHTPKTISQLELIQRQLDIEDEKPAWIRADRAFHDALYEPAAREKTLEVIHSLRAPIERFSLVELSPGTRRRGWSKEHHSIIAAVSTGDKDGALGTLRDHLRNSQKVVIDRLSGIKARA